MRALFGIAELQSMMASPMQAARRSAVSSSWANATVGSAPRSKPAAPSTLLRILIMTISHWRKRGATDCDRRLRLRPVAAESCDGHHIFSLFAHTNRRGFAARTRSRPSALYIAVMLRMRPKPPAGIPSINS
jgi:hypothetical protein